jgi:hypothetical protein
MTYGESRSYDRETEDSKEVVMPLGGRCGGAAGDALEALAKRNFGVVEAIVEDSDEVRPLIVRSNVAGDSLPCPGRAKAFRSAGLGLGSLDRTVTRRCVAHQFIEEMMCRVRHVLDGPVERRLVDL